MKESQIFRPESADFDFWKFWSTNENFEIYKNSTFSKFSSKSRMRAFDSVLESSNMIFFDFEILGTTWVPSGWPICTWNKPKTSFFWENPQMTFSFTGLQHGTKKLLNFHDQEVWYLSFPKPCRLSSYEV